MVPLIEEDIMSRMNLIRKLRKYKHWHKVLICSVYIFALIIRVVFAKNVQLWRDEVYIFYVSRGNGFWDLLLQNHWDTLHPPLYFIFLHYWQKLSISPLFLRLPSLIASAFSLWMVIKIAKRYFGRYKYMPIVSLVFFAFSQPQISINTLARPYAFVTLAILLSLYYFVDVFESGKHWFLFGLLNFVVFFSDYSGVWLLVSYLFFIIFILLKRRLKNMKKMLGLIQSSIVTLFLSIFWIPFFIKGLGNALQMEKSGLGAYQWKTGLQQLPFFAGVLNGDILIRLGIIDGIWLSWLIIFVSIFGILVIGKYAKKYSVFFAILMILPIVLSLSFSVLISPIFLARNLHVVTIPILLGLSLTVSYLMERKLIIGLLVLVFIIINFLQNPLEVQYADAPIDWRSIATFIHTRSEGTSVVLGDDIAWMYDPIKYYHLLDYKTCENKDLNIKKLHRRQKYHKYNDAFLINVNFDTRGVLRSDHMKYFFKNNQCGIDEMSGFAHSHIIHCKFY
jgi:hypothetical protein